MVEFKSSDNGATIKFTLIDSFADGMNFMVEVNSPFGSAKIHSSTYYSGSPAILFKSIASEWKGWKGDKVWGDLESGFVLTARSDSIGHTELTVKLTDYLSSFQTVLIFEAGQLEKMSIEIEKLLPY
jgi:Family of unknown function (DUF6228)